MIYYLIAIQLLLTSLFEKGQVRQFLTFAGALTILFVGGLRYEVGTDWAAYLDLFDSMSAGYSADEYREESGFLILVDVFKFFGANFNQFVFGIFLLSFSIKVFTAWRLQADLPVVLCVYLYTIFMIYDLNGLRQGLAMSLIFLSSIHAMRRQWLKFLVIVLLASTIHTAAIMGLSLYALAMSTWLNNHGAISRVKAVALLVLFGLAIARFIAGTEIAATLEAVQALSKYSYYIESEDYQEVFSFFSFATLQRLFIVVLLIFSYEQIKADVPLKSLLLNIYVFSFFLYFALSFNLEIMARASFYFKGFDIFILGLIYASSKTTRERILLISVLAILAIGSIYRLLSIPDGMLVPYRSVLDFL